MPMLSPTTSPQSIRSSDVPERTVRNVSADQERRDEEQPAKTLGPVDLARSVLSWIVVAMATLVVVWVLVFAVTRGDVLGLVAVVAVGFLLVSMALFRRRRR